MKRSRLLWTIVSLCALSGCTTSDIDEVVEPQRPQQKQEVVIHAVEAADSRAIHGTEEEHTSFRWQKGVDKIGLLLGHSDSYDEWWETDHYRFSNTTDGDKAVFVYDADPDQYFELPQLEVGQTIVAYYPYGSAVSSWYNVSKPYLRSSLGSLLQKGDNNTEHLYHGDYMYSRPITLEEKHFDSEGNLQLEMEFGHIFAKMRFTVKNSTDQPLDINSLVYRSTKEDDIMQGTLCLDATTGLLDLDNKGDWGGVPPSNSAVLEVEDIVLQPGQTATLWMWMMPLDFTAGNSDGRKADIMVNTSAGVFRVQNTNFNTRFVAGNVYRQGFELTSEKLLADYAYVSDPNFANILYYGNIEGDVYDEEGNFIGGSYTPLYNLELQPYPLFDGENWEVQLTTGCYIKISEAAKLTSMNIAIQMNNALSLDGLQYFTGLKQLDVNLGSDTDPAMSLRALKFGTLKELESFSIMMTKVPSIDFSANTKLKTISLGQVPQLEKIIGLEKLTCLEAFGIGETPNGFELDLSVCPTLKSVDISSFKPYGTLNLSNLQLSLLNISLPNLDAVNSANLSVEELHNFAGTPFPSGAPRGVKRLYLSGPYDTDTSMSAQFSEMTEIEYLECGGMFPDLVFTSAQASVKELVIYCNEGTNLPSGWSNLTGCQSIIINKSSLAGEWCFDELDLSGMTSLLSVDILVKKINSFIAPPSLKTLNLTIQNSLTFNPTAALETIHINSVRGSITLGNGPAVKELYLIGEAGTNEPAIILGAYPLLERLTVDTGSYSTVSFGASEYPSLTYYSVSYGKYIKTIPSATVFPKLEELSLSSYSGVRTLDLTAYNHLKKLYVYESNFGNGAISITAAQRDYAQANAASKVFSGITATSVSSIYKIVE
ncbi:MAG: fimbrillin family protein [Alistipes sp.]|nr:fimbrillin family protein [Alistipes sp.]